MAKKDGLDAGEAAGMMMLTLIIGLGVGVIFGTEFSTSSYEKVFAKTECAQFSPLTGEFEILEQKTEEDN